jgi:predicted ribosome quality control (RQC) complex YloA/Tae2 family protein
MMGKFSNIILVGEDGAVMDGIKRVPSRVNRYRVTMPNHRYVPPPPQDKRDPMAASPNVLSLELSRAAESDADAPAWKGLVSGFGGISPTLGREVVFRALGDSAIRASEVAPDPRRLESVLREMQGLFGLGESGAWQPTIAWREAGEGERKALDFAPYRLTHLEAAGAVLQESASISEAAALYFEAAENMVRHSALKAQVRAGLLEQRSREEHKLFALREQLERAEAAEGLRRKGEYLLAFMHTLQPGQRMLELPDEGLKIALDPALTPVENAQAYFKDYHKARAAQEGLPELVRQVEMRVGYLDEMLTSLDLATSHEDIKAVQAEANMPEPGRQQAEQKPGKKGKGKQEKVPQPLRLQTRRGGQILVGRTARQNDAATFRLATPDDIWFHARGVPGAHVILRAGGAPLTQEDIDEAASYAAAYSKAREEAQVDVVYTERRYVRKVPNSPPGFVTFRNEQVVRVAPGTKL